MAPDGGKQITISIPALLLIISLCMGGTWTVTEAWQSRTSLTNKCINDISQQVVSNTRRIEAVERAQEDMQGIPEQIAGMSSDLRYLRQSVEILMKELRERNKEN